MNTIMKQMTNKFSILATVLIVGIGLPSAACGQSDQSSNQTVSNQIQMSEMPFGVKNSTYDNNVNKKSSLFVKIDTDNKIYVRKPGTSEFKDRNVVENFNYAPLTDENLINEITIMLQDKTPAESWVYLQADTTLKFGKLTELFEKMAKSEDAPNKVQFVVNPLKEVEKSRQTEGGGYVLTLILPEKNVQSEDTQKPGGIGNGTGISDDLTPPPPPGYKPKPKSAEQIAAAEKAKQSAIEKAEARKKIKIEKLTVEMESAEKFKFNNQPQTIEELKANLKKIFDERTAYDIYIDGTNEINKTVYMKIVPNVNYDEAIKLIDEIYGLGANRMYLDNLQKN